MSSLVMTMASWFQHYSRYFIAGTRLNGVFFHEICCWWLLTISPWIYLDSLALTEVSKLCEVIWRHVGLFTCNCWCCRRLLLFVETLYYWNPFTSCCCHFGVTHLWWLWFEGLYIISIRVWFNPPCALRGRICKQFLLQKLINLSNGNKFIQSFYLVL